MPDFTRFLTLNEDWSLAAGGSVLTIGLVLMDGLIFFIWYHFLSGHNALKEVNANNGMYIGI